MLAFFTDMNTWEVGCARLFEQVQLGELDHQAAKARMISSLQDVFARHCTAKASRLRVSGGTCTFAEPPEYDPAAEAIESVTRQGTRYLVRTKQSHHFQASYVYTVVREGGEFRISGKKLVGLDGTLMSTYL
jgi:hypothetical protein